MAALGQYYGDPGVPLVVDGDPRDPVTAWHSQRVRMHSWLDALPDGDWGGPTRCDGWDTTLLVRHLSSATQFLGYTLHEASLGTATTLLLGMDTRTTVASAAEPPSCWATGHRPTPAPSWPTWTPASMPDSPRSATPGCWRRPRHLRAIWPSTSHSAISCSTPGSTSTT